MSPWCIPRAKETKCGILKMDCFQFMFPLSFLSLEYHFGLTDYSYISESKDRLDGITDAEIGNNDSLIAYYQQNRFIVTVKHKPHCAQGPHL